MLRMLWAYLVLHFALTLLPCLQWIFFSELLWETWLKVICKSHCKACSDTQLGMLTTREAPPEKQKKIKFETAVPGWMELSAKCFRLVANPWVWLLVNSAFFDNPSVTNMSLTMQSWSCWTVTLLLRIQLLSCVFCGNQHDRHACARR